MTDNMKSKEELIPIIQSALWLECEKPEKEMDIQYIEQCTKMLTDITDSYYSFTYEQLNERYNKIMSDRKLSGERKKAVKLCLRFRRLAAAVAAAAMLVCSTITIGAFNPDVWNMLIHVFDMERGASVTVGDQVYTNLGQSPTYDSLEELVQQEELDIIYPETWPDGVEVESVLRLEDEISVKFTDEGNSLLILLDSTMEMDYDSNPTKEKYTINNIDSYIYEFKTDDSAFYSSYTKYKDNIYAFTIKEHDVLLSILDQLCEGVSYEED